MADVLLKLRTLLAAENACLALLASLVAVSGITSSARAATTASPAADLATRFDAIFKGWSSSESAGCAVGVAQNDAPVLLRAYGEADLEHDVANTTDTVFEAGSSSKQFVAASILILAEQHKLSLSDDVRKYIPELPIYGRTITIEHLLTHTSGLRDWGGVEVIAGWPRTTREYTMSDVLNIAARQRSLNFAPGAQYSYSNTGYNLAAMIVARVSGQSLNEFDSEYIFKPLGMTKTQWRDDFRRVVKGRAIAYTKTPAGYQQNMPFEDAYGNGGLLTTVGDLLKWNAGLNAARLGSFVSAGLIKNGVLSSGQNVVYAHGLIVRKYRGYLELAHPGATAGYTAWVGRYPEQRLSIALLCNASEADSAQLAHEVAALFLPVRPSSGVKEVARVHEDPAAFAGQFIGEFSGMPMTLEQESGQLKIKDGPVLSRVSAVEFNADDADLVFDGPDAFTLRTEQMDPVKYRRAPAFSPPSPGELAQLAGEYASDEADATYTVKLEKDGLTMTLKNRPDITLALTPIYQGAFYNDGVLIRFRRDPNGQVYQLSVGVDRVRDLGFRLVSTPAVLN